jgi:hypothetical protein
LEKRAREILCSDGLSGNHTRGYRC